MYHDLVFEAAECVFGEKGFDHATMQDVASEAGISLKTLYAAFPGKQDLYEEIQLVRGAAFVAQVLEASSRSSEPPSPGSPHTTRLRKNCSPKVACASIGVTTPGCLHIL